MLNTLQEMQLVGQGFSALQHEDESDFKPYVLHRQTPPWHSNQPVQVSCKCGLLGVVKGELPIGLLPAGTIVSIFERDEVLRHLMQVPDTKYNSTSSDQSVRVWGRPFVDSSTVIEHLTGHVDPRVEALTAPLVSRLEDFLHNAGFEVEPLIDPVTLLRYQAGVFRAINVVNEASVLHTDDFIRDGLKKPDFHLPERLVDREFFQISFNVLLDTGGYEPDALFVHNRFHIPSDEARVLPNGWQFPLDLVADYEKCQFTPSEGEEYVFSTINYHDVRGGSPLANRVTFSAFALYVPSLNLMMLYN